MDKSPVVYPYNGVLLISKQKLGICTTAWINLKIIMLSERHQRIK